uniref:Putative GTP-binding protein n=1 Tax=Arabidopsis thaliana TaxID=3702 RepID=Q9SJ87_ARATH|nr:putative GTP-binding protein [Arabidopsis thaliana]
MLDIKYANHNMSIILIGHKCDLVRKRAISKEEGGEFAKQHCLPASARTSQNIEETAENILQNIESLMYPTSHWASKLDIHVLKVKLEEDMVPSPRMVVVVVKVSKMLILFVFTRSWYFL